MVLQVRGVAHPPPNRNGRADKADLSAAEISVTNISGRPLLNEHNSKDRVGTCLASWEGPDGSLRIAANVETPEAIAQVRNGKLRGLSLGTDMVLDESGDVLYRGQTELSLCAEGRRDGTWIDTVNGKTVHRHQTFSKKSTWRTSYPSAKLDNPLSTHSKVETLHRIDIMAEPAAASASAPVVDAPMPSAADAERDALVERLKAELAQAQEKAAMSDARNQIFVDREREKVTGFQEEAKYFFNDFVAGEADAEAKADMSPLNDWVDNYTKKTNITEQTPLARMMSVASKGVKRLKDEASAGSKAQETLGATMKELEEVKASDAKKTQRIEELETLCNERQQAAEKIQAQLEKAGVLAAKFDFSKLTSREADVKGEPAKEEAADVTSMDTAPDNAGLKMVTSEASRGAASSSSGNPLEYEHSQLMNFVEQRGQGALRVRASNTGHAWLGAQEGSGNPLQSVLNSM